MFKSEVRFERCCGIVKGFVRESHARAIITQQFNSLIL